MSDSQALLLAPAFWAMDRIRAYAIKQQGRMSMEITGSYQRYGWRLTLPTGEVLASDFGKPTVQEGKADLRRFLERLAEIVLRPH